MVKQNKILALWFFIELFYLNVIFMFKYRLHQHTRDGADHRMPLLYPFFLL